MILAIPNAASASSNNIVFENEKDFNYYSDNYLKNKEVFLPFESRPMRSISVPDNKVAVIKIKSPLINNTTVIDFGIAGMTKNLAVNEIYYFMLDGGKQINLKLYYRESGNLFTYKSNVEYSVDFYDIPFYGKITNFKAVPSQTFVDLSWDLENTNNDDLILFYSNGVNTEELPVTQNTKKVTGLDPNTTYTFGLRLKTKKDELSDMVLVTTKTLSDDVTDLMYDLTHNSVILNWKKPLTITSADKILIYQDGEKIKELAHNVSSNMINGLEPNTSYIFKVAIERENGTITEGETIVIVTDEEPDDDVPPANITGLNATATENSITLNWTNPIDTDFSHVQIFRDGHLILPNLNDTTYTDAGLTSGTQYVYRIVSVDENGNSSSGVIQTVSTVAETDNTPPATPQHITVSNGNKSGTVSWVHNLETDLAGYNLYVNGVKVNTGLILGNHYVLTNLDNGTHYNIELTAVDVSGNESDKSQALTITPDEQALPIVETKYDLKSVADGTASWFNGLWLILAFSVAIPLAFLIARRVKALIVGG